MALSFPFNTTRTLADAMAEERLYPAADAALTALYGPGWKEGLPPYQVEAARRIVIEAVAVYQREEARAL